MATIPKDLQTELEGVIDTYGLANVVDGLAEIASEKADRIRAKGEPRTSRKWSRAACYLRNTEAHIAIEGL